jgi:hypothetical protein
VKRSEPGGVGPPTGNAVNGISTKQSGGEKPLSAALLKQATPKRFFKPFPRSGRNWRDSWPEHEA